MPRPRTTNLPRYMVQRGGRYWARRGVPADLRDLLGRTELLTALGADRREAESLLRLAVADHERELREARRTKPKARQSRTPALAPSRPPSAVAVNTLAHIRELRLLTEDAARRDRGEPLERVGAEELLWGRVASGRSSDAELERELGLVFADWRAQGLTEIRPDDSEWRPACRAVGLATLRAWRTIVAREGGDADALDHDAQRVALEAVAKPTASLGSAIDARLAIMREEGASPDSIRGFERAMRDLQRHVGHDDLGRIRKPDLFAWIDTLKPRMTLRTIRRTYVTAVSGMFALAVRRELIPTNPAADLGIKGEKAKADRSKGYSDAEAKALLETSRGYTRRTASNGNTEPLEQARARRWAPVLLAYTGARVGEICQLRRQDVRLDDPVPHIHITPEAGTVKTGGYRDVPIHPDLLAEGFGEFVRSVDAGHLFVAKGSTAKSVASKLSAWVRALPACPAGVAPSHGWRHRFKSLARRAEVDPRVADAIQGHAGRTASDDYGDVDLETRAKALARMTFA